MHVRLTLALALAGAELETGSGHWREEALETGGQANCNQRSPPSTGRSATGQVQRPCSGLQSTCHLSSGRCLSGGGNLITRYQTITPPPPARPLGNLASPDQQHLTALPPTPRQTATRSTRQTKGKTKGCVTSQALASPQPPTHLRSLHPLSTAVITAVPIWTSSRRRSHPNCLPPQRRHPPETSR